MKSKSYSIELCGYSQNGYGCDTVLVGGVKEISNFIIGLEDYELDKYFVVEWRDGKKIRSTSAKDYRGGKT